MTSAFKPANWMALKPKKKRSGKSAACAAVRCCHCRCVILATTSGVKPAKVLLDMSSSTVEGRASTWVALSICQAAKGMAAAAATGTSCSCTTCKLAQLPAGRAAACAGVRADSWDGSKLDKMACGTAANTVGLSEASCAGLSVRHTGKLSAPSAAAWLAVKASSEAVVCAEPAGVAAVPTLWVPLAWTTCTRPEGAWAVCSWLPDKVAVFVRVKSTLPDALEISAPLFCVRLAACTLTPVRPVRPVFCTTLPVVLKLRLCAAKGLSTVMVLAPALRVKLPRLGSALVCKLTPWVRLLALRVKAVSPMFFKNESEMTEVAYKELEAPPTCSASPLMVPPKVVRFTALAKILPYAGTVVLPHT